MAFLIVEIKNGERTMRVVAHSVAVARSICPDELGFEFLGKCARHVPRTIFELSFGFSKYLW